VKEPTKARLVRLVCSRPRHATLVPDAIITYIAGTITESLQIPVSLKSPSLPTSGPDPVAPSTIPLDSAPSVSLHSTETLSAETLSAETLSIPLIISSPLAIASNSSLSSPDTNLPHATPALDDGVSSELAAEQSAAKPPSKLEQWWLDHRKGIVSGAKTLLEVASKVLDDVPAGGSIAAKALELGASALERVQVMLAHQ
jgi:hypothetical protein